MLRRQAEEREAAAAAAAVGGGGEASGAAAAAPSDGGGFPPTPTPPSLAGARPSDRDEFLAALCGEHLPDDERLILCGFVGDPGKVGPAAWRPRPWRPGRHIELGAAANAYVTVASFGRSADNSFRRRTETFGAGLALMVDDVGTKVDPEVVRGVPPTARVETSPNNEQWWYMLDRPERDAARFDASSSAASALSCS